MSFLGIFLPVCECGNLPLARGLIVKGFTVSESMTFLLAAPIVNPITIITTGQAFGFGRGRGRGYAERGVCGIRSRRVVREVHRAGLVLAPTPDD
ncbi:permease [Glaciihabitans sp. UYNi722]|uniref:permease n=1 Tax=Glaciihabitans sp. UYNi722 TaxID=3156344 RepID=UPI003392973B